MIACFTVTANGAEKKARTRAGTRAGKRAGKRAEIRAEIRAEERVETKATWLPVIFAALLVAACGEERETSRYQNDTQGHAGESVISTEHGQFTLKQIGPDGGVENDPARGNPANGNHENGDRKNGPSQKRLVQGSGRSKGQSQGVNIDLAAMMGGFPLLPNAQIIRASLLDKDGEGEAAIIAFNSPDSIVKIAQFYRNEAAKAGVKLDVDMRLDQGHLLAGKSPKGGVFSLKITSSTAAVMRAHDGSGGNGAGGVSTNGGIDAGTGGGTDRQAGADFDGPDREGFRVEAELGGKLPKAAQNRGGNGPKISAGAADLTHVQLMVGRQ